MTGILQAAVAAGATARRALGETNLGLRAALMTAVRARVTRFSDGEADPRDTAAEAGGETTRDKPSWEV